ncbi:MAG TPA: hypothetical protein VF338_03235 [Leptolinea sp.]
MELWRTQSHPGKQLAAAAGCILAGLVMAAAFRNFNSVGSNTAAGFFLGVLLFLIGAAGLLVSGKQTVVVDPSARLIIIEDSNSLQTKKRTIAFAEISDIGIGFLGKESNHVTWYYLLLKFTNGEEYPLFAPGRFYEGGTNRSIVAGWRQRLENYLAQ